MKSFLFSILTLILLISLISWYAFSLIGFSEETKELLTRLPENAEDWESASAAEEICKELLDHWKEKELFIHLAIPFERMESTHEKLLLLYESCRAKNFRDAAAYRALCLEEIEILASFEKITLPNLL